MIQSKHRAGVLVSSPPTAVKLKTSSSSQIFSFQGLARLTAHLTNVIFLILLLNSLRFEMEPD